LARLGTLTVAAPPPCRFLSKFGILCFLGRRPDFALRASAGLAAMLVAGAGAWMLMRP
jgi:hypothetical protein